MNKRKYLVYKITNRFNNKIYIGCHSTLNESDRYMGSGVEIREALKKEGRKSFVKEILFTFDTKEEMLAKEKELVTKEFCMDENTYNRIEGGGVYATVDMITVINPEGGFMNVYKNDPRWLSGELVGSTTGSCVLRNKMDINPQLRKKFSEQNSENLKQAHKNGKFRYDNFLGKQHKQESKEKIGLANSIKQKGENNSQFGTCWITKEGINKKIKKENLDEYISQGWLKGRNSSLV